MPYVLFRPRYEYSHLAALAFPRGGRKDEKKRKEERKEGGEEYRGLELYEDAYFIYIYFFLLFFSLILAYKISLDLGNYFVFC